MTVRRVVKMGNEALSSPSLVVPDVTAVKHIVDDMYDTMQQEMGIGIAAPQIGHNARILMFGFESNTRYPDEEGVPFTILINPTLEILSEEMTEGWEACLSVPGLCGLVPRYKKIRYQGYDMNGELITREASDFHARLVQHEYDHLDGILYPYRMTNLRNFGFRDEIQERM